MDAIRAAVNAGADAVYAGGSMFGARAFAENPETQELLEAIDYCHLHGAKLYLTVNTLLKEHELKETLPEFLAPIYEHGVDAVLVQDFGVFRFLREIFPDLPLHASTQMTVTGPDGVRLLQEMGAERVVLSRELSLAEIRLIREKTDVELETFVHGALCYCYSGKCLMSSMIGGRSGNRGRCAQPCRLPWDLYEKPSDVRNRKQINERSEQYLLSPKDICTLRLIPDLVDAGIISFKIEGRMKSPEYAAGVTAMYRRHIDLYLEKGREGFRVDEADRQLAQKLFSRGDFSEGYYQERNGRDMMLLEEKPEQTGSALRSAQEAVAGIRERYLLKPNKVLLTARVSIHAGAPASMQVSDLDGNSFRAEGFVPSRATNRPSDREAVLKQVSKTGNSEFEFESIDLDLEEGLFLPVRDLNELRRAALEGIRQEILTPYRRKKPVQKPEDEPDREDAAAPDAEGRGIDADTSITDGISKETISSDAVAASENPADSIEAGQPRPDAREDAMGGKYVHGLYMGGFRKISHPAVTASVCTQDQLEAAIAAKTVGGIYLDVSLCTAKNVDLVWNSAKKVYLMLPAVWRADTARIVQEKMKTEFGSFSPAMKSSLDGIVVGCYDQLQALKESDLLNDNDGFEVIADASLYTWNSVAREQLRALGVTMDTLPYECSLKELAERGCKESECVIYGYQPLMLSAQCLTKTTLGCERFRRGKDMNGKDRTGERQGASGSSDHFGVRYLKDRKGVLFAVKNDCMLCLNTIYNSVPLDLVSLRAQVYELSPASVRYLFTIENGDQTKRILKGQLPDAVTRGHFRKGIE